MALGSGIKQQTSVFKTIDSAIVSLLNDAVNQWHDGNIPKENRDAIAKEVGNIYVKNGYAPVNMVHLRITGGGTSDHYLSIDVHFRNVDIIPINHKSTIKFKF